MRNGVTGEGGCGGQRILCFKVGAIQRLYADGHDLEEREKLVMGGEDYYIIYKMRK